MAIQILPRKHLRSRPTSADEASSGGDASSADERHLAHKRALAQGSDDAFTSAMELALTPALAGFLGYLLDQGLGLLPLFTVVFSLWAFAVVSWRVWQRYDRRMRRLEEERA